MGGLLWIACQEADHEEAARRSLWHLQEGLEKVSAWAPGELELDTVNNSQLDGPMV